MNIPHSAEQFIHPKRLSAAAFAASPLVATGIGYAAERWLWPHIIFWAADRNLAHAEQITRVAFLVAAAIVCVSCLSLAAAVWFWLVAVRIYRSAAFPPRGYPIVVKMRVLRGAAAVRQAHVHLFAGVLCMGVGGGVVWAMFSIFPISALLRAASG